MRRNLAAYKHYQVFLNYPFDEDFAHLADALHFAVTAAGLLPLCAKDLSVPDRPRLEMLIDAIGNCHYSAHDFSRSKGEGSQNLSRMNMPIEMGMALYHALQTQRQEHRCVFFVPDLNTYQKFASDLAGLDPKNYDNNQQILLGAMYEWLRDVVPSSIFNSQPVIQVIDKFNYYKSVINEVNSSGVNSKPSHNETQELMFQICSIPGWWDWRATKAGREEFPQVPLAWKNGINPLHD